MFRILLLFFITIKLSAQPFPFLKVIKDSSNLPNFGKVAFIEQDSLFIHILFNSNYTVGGFCDAGNGSIYYVKLNKNDGQIISTKAFRSSVSKVTTACMYKNSIYFGGEMSPLYVNRNAFIIKFNTQTNSIVWQRFFHTTWWNSTPNVNMSCCVTQIELNPAKNKLLFYGVGNCAASSVSSITGFGSFKGILDTANSFFNLSNYGYYFQPGKFKSKPKFTPAKGGTKSYLICSDSGSNNVNISLDPNNNNYFSGDNGYYINLISTGNHYVNKIGSKIIYLIDRQNQSTCIITDSLNNILVSNDFIGLHARSMSVKKGNAVLTFVNDLGLGKADKIINIKVDTLMNVLAAKKMSTDTFQYSVFTCASVMDTGFVYNLYSKNEFSVTNIFVYKSNFSTLLCNEQVFTPTLSAITISTIAAAVSATGTAIQTTFTANSYNQGLRDSLLCHASNSITQISFTMNSSRCAEGTESVSANTGTNTALTYTWTSSPPGPIFSSSNSSATNIYFAAAGTYTIGLAVLFSGSSGYDTNVITILPNPSIILSQSSFTTCIANNVPKFSKPVSITVSGASSYTWQPPQPPPLIFPIPPDSAITVRPLTSTCYTVYGSNAGCTGSAVACVTVIPRITINVTPVNTLICQSVNIDEYAVLTASNPSPPAFGLSPSHSYSWTGCGIGGILTSPFSSSIAVSPSTICTYTVEILDSLNCVSLPAMATVSVQNCTDLKADLLDAAPFAVYPNPAKDKIFVQYESASVKEAKLSLWNSLGQNVYILNNTGRKEEIDLSLLSQGIYYLKIQNNSEQKIFKIFKVAH